MNPKTSKLKLTVSNEIKSRQRMSTRSKKAVVTTGPLGRNFWRTLC